MNEGTIKKAVIVSAVFFCSFTAASAAQSPCEKFGITPSFSEDVKKDPSLLSKLPYGVLFYYQQNSINLSSDLIGDMSLATEALYAPKKIEMEMTNNQKGWDEVAKAKEKGLACAEFLFNIRPDTPEYADDIPFLIRPDQMQAVRDSEISPEDKIKFVHAIAKSGSVESRKCPINAKNFVRMFNQIINEEVTTASPSTGKVHTWSPEFRKAWGKDFALVLKRSKLLAALSLGKTSQYMITGNETALIEYINARPDRSVTPDQVLRYSYRLNKGNVYLTLLTIENALSKYWRAADREKIITTTKLYPITHCIGANCEYFGPWYHFFGIMLYGYVKGAEMGMMVGAIEGLGSFVMNDFQPEYQENKINVIGGAIGAMIRRSVENRQYLDQRIDKSYTDVSSYLTTADDMPDRIEDAKSNIIPQKALPGKKRIPLPKNR